MVIHGNRQEDLRDLLAAWLQRTPLAPLENEIMLVQSNGIAQWLKLALARPPQAGGLGISAAVDMQLPGRFLWQAYRAALGEAAVPATSPFDKSRLAWRLLRLLPEYLDDAAFAPLRNLLGEGRDWRRQYRLALQVADLFDQYQVFRADWLDDWEHRNDVLRDNLRQRATELPPAQRWQPLLWRRLLNDVPAAQRDSHRAAVHRRFMQQMQAADFQPQHLPRRIVVFGITSLPQQVLEALTALARFSQVLLLVTNPCRHYWADIIEDRELLMAQQRRHAAKPELPPEPRYEDLHLHANPLLAAWGKQGRDFIRQLDAFDQPDRYRDRFASIKRSIDVFQDIGNDSLLHQVQQAVLDLEPVSAQRKVLPDERTSLHFHIAHSPQREVEILHDRLLDLFEQAARQGRPLAPRDVMVMVPDIRTYAPHVQAVFGRIAQDDPRYLPYSVADQPGRGASPLLVALEALLGLGESRFTASNVLDLLDVPALRRRFDIHEDELPVLRRWIDEAGIRWGLDGEQKQTLELPPDEQNSWRFGLRRMLLGYATGDAPSLDDIAPYAEVGGLDARLLGPLSELLDTQERYWQLFSSHATPQQWSERLRRLLRDCFDTRGDDLDTLRIDRLEEALDAWLDACHEAGFNQAIPIAVVGEEWLQAIDQAHLSQRFMGGAVNFGTLLPMRAIPFRVVCLLGMNDGDYPRRLSPPDFDLMARAGQHRPGDRSRREDDRYMFLEALLSARDVLHISWIGHSVRDNSELPPSVLVGQLRDYLAAGWRLPGDERGAGDMDSRLLAAITTTHPLQAFSPRYFSADAASNLFTYAWEWAHARRGIAPAEDAPLAPWQAEPVLAVAKLQRFLASPAASFYAERLKVRFDETDTGLADDEPFALDALENYAAKDALLQGALAAGEDHAAATLTDATRQLRQQGVLPAGGFGALAMDDIGHDVRQILKRWHGAVARWTQRLDVQELDYVYRAGAIDTFRVEGWLDDMRAAGDGSLARLLPIAGRLRQGKHIRYDRLLGAWVLQLLANACGIAMSTHMLAADATVVLEACTDTEAAALLDQLLDTWQQGMQAPLPIGRRSAYAWLLAQAAGRDPHDAAQASYEGIDVPGAPAGEVHYEPCLARMWPSFSALYAAGFEHWLAPYRGLLEHARMEAEA
ncbi:exodeoxyribonuclease V subunit gamma [Dyella sp. 7MK23]|uniref:RecBCD enzyme subunit RecC n=2 Tax=Dyella acidiphila TaxID=2775866 RepID=A0ABR9GES5_9GAMM|nr:exodeoxyribonuclease V subunit gamma [Dyella acidiphila]MBE1162533.1 exodeoxyribonuclease V subunit gamma [Dyella acidiphila]